MWFDLARNYGFAALALLPHIAPMRKRVYVVLALVLVAAFGLAIWHGFRPKEPVYDGKPLSYWMNRMRVGEAGFTGSHPDHYPVVVPGHGSLTLSSNAVPFLIKYLERRESAAHRFCYDGWAKLPTWMRRWLSRPTDIDRLRGSAALLLARLGADARPAIPTLIKVLEEETDYRRFLIPCVLQSLGAFARSDPAARMALVQAVRSKDFPDCDWAANGLIVAGVPRQEVEAVVRNRLNDRDSSTREWARDFLGLDPPTQASRP